MAAIAVLISAVSWHTPARAQPPSDLPPHISHSSAMTFMERDGTCIYGAISRVTPTEITVNEGQELDVTIKRAELLQISQGDALLFTAVNSWTTVEQSSHHVYPREAFVLKLKSGRTVSGKPVRTTPDSIFLKRGLRTSEYQKAAIATVDYLRLRPESSNFDYFSQEAPALLFFDPEFYYRAAGLEGRIRIRLFDSATPITNPTGKCRHN